MGIRETLNKNPMISAGAIGAVILIVLGFIIFTSMGSGPASTAGQKAFFSIDDGKNYFADDASKIPPFQKDGKEAVQAIVFSFDGNKKVVYLKRFTPEAKRKLEAATSNKNKPDMAIVDAINFTGVEVKAPGDKEWVKQNDAKAAKIMNPQYNGVLDVVSP